MFELSTLLFCLWKEDSVLWGEGRADQLREQKRRTPPLAQILNAAMIVRDSDMFDPSGLGLHTEAIREVWEQENSRKQIQQIWCRYFNQLLSFNPTDRNRMYGIEATTSKQSLPYTLGSLLSSVRLATLNIVPKNQLLFYVEQVLFPLVKEKPEPTKKGFVNLEQVELALRKVAQAVSQTQMSCFNPQHVYRLSEKSQWMTDSIVALQPTPVKYSGSMALDQQRSRLKNSLFIFVIEVLGGGWLPEEKEVDPVELRKHFTRREAKVTHTFLRLNKEKAAKNGI